MMCPVDHRWAPDPQVNVTWPLLMFQDVGAAVHAEGEAEEVPGALPGHPEAHLLERALRQDHLGRHPPRPDHLLAGPHWAGHLQHVPRDREKGVSERPGRHG